MARNWAIYSGLPCAPDSNRKSPERAGFPRSSRFCVKVYVAPQCRACVAVAGALWQAGLTLEKLLLPSQAIMSFGYCERASQAFWAEPMNALSNGGFILAAIAGLLLYRRSGRRDWPAAALIALVVMIGIGSFLFHTMPQRWTLLADVLPIQFFAFSYFGLALVRFMGARPAVAAGGTLFFLLASFLLVSGLGALLPPGMRGSGGYASFVLALFGVAFAVRMRGEGDTAARLLGLAGLVFALSLSLRTLDQVLCQSVPFGTHWLWHLLNAMVLYLLLRAAIDRPSAN